MDESIRIRIVIRSNTSNTQGVEMRDSARLIAAALLGAGVAIAGTAAHAGLVAAAADTTPAPASSAAGHLDARFDRLEKQLSALDNQIALDFDAARSHVELMCGRR
jgi:hypothetical protein